jgi:cation diffusion facilitator CzcD-associated flavoprotein CzcO
MGASILPALVIGAGPAGLATSHELKRRSIEHIVLERGDKIAYAWTKLYDSLTLHTGKHMSALPGMPFPNSTPLFPTRIQFLDYLNQYVQRFNLPVETGCEVTRVERVENYWRVHTTQGTKEARQLVVATGIISSPYKPDFPGQADYQGRLIHSVEYLNPVSFRGHRVLVVGVGNSGGEIAPELAMAGVKVDVAVRSGAMILPRTLFGIPIQYYSCLVIAFPKKIQKAIATLTGKIAALRRGPPVLPPAVPTDCPDVPLIGFHLVDAIRQKRIRVKGALEKLTKTGACFADGSQEDYDDIIMATGYKATVGMLEGLIHMDACGFAQRKERVESTEQSDLYFVGHNYDGTGGLFNIARDSQIVGKRVAAKNFNA